MHPGLLKPRLVHLSALFVLGLLHPHRRCWSALSSVRGTISETDSFGRFSVRCSTPCSPNSAGVFTVGDKNVYVHYFSRPPVRPRRVPIEMDYQYYTFVVH